MNPASANAIQVYRSGNQTGVVTGTWTPIELNAEVVDQAGDFDTGTYTFTATKAGWYWIFATVRFTASVTDTDIGIRIRKNSNTTAQARAHISFNGTPSVCIGKLVSLDGATDTITVEARQNSGSDKIIDAGTENTYLTAFKISTN